MYAAQINGNPLSFEVLGVWRRNMVIRDRETRSVWQHATGECIYGPMQGAQLKPIGGELIRWRAWVNKHPHTELAVEPESPVRGLLPNEKMYRLFKITERFAAPPVGARGEKRLPLHEDVIGVKIGDHARAYPLALLRERSVIDDTVNGQPITLTYDADGDSVRVVKGNARHEPVQFSRQWWLGWSEFEPQTDVYREH